MYKDKAIHTLSLQSIKCRPDNVVVDISELARAYKRQRGIYSHAASVWASVSIENPLVVLARRQRHEGVTVAKCQYADLVAFEEFLNDDRLASSPELFPNHHFMKGELCFGLTCRENNTFPSSEAVHFDYNARTADVIDVPLGIIIVTKTLVICRRNAILLHKGFREGFGSLYLSSFLRRGKARDST